jgi:CheY-like chemotaxis protein
MENPGFLNSPLDLAGNRTARGKALVVDDESTSLLVLKSLLEKQGFFAIPARNGEEAVAVFEREAPDIVFVDIVMPGISGYETVRRIKTLAGDRFVPAIFLTGLTEEHSLAKCIEAGGDDFLTKPVSVVLLQAKIAAAERIAHLYRTVQRQHHQLLFEQELAKQVYAKTVQANRADPGEIYSLQRSASVFSGDLLLAGRSPSGALHVLIGDFTGHGLAAAIGALPAAEVFRGMTGKGFTAAEILTEINRKLRALLPTGMFLAAVFVSLSQDGRSVRIWNSGLPDVFILDRDTGRVKNRLSSCSVPLGILPSLGPMDLSLFEVNSGDQVVVITDGIVEALDSKGELFGEGRVMACLESGGSETVFSRLVAGLEEFTAGASQEDDITLAVIPCRAERPWLLPVDSFSLVESHEAVAEEEVQAVPDLDSEKFDWQWEVELGFAVLRRIDAVPLLVDTVVDLQDLQEHRQFLFTILSELLNNALDHGLLDLDSRIKDSPEGFVRYFQERQERLARLREGYILVGFAVKTEDDHGRLHIRVEDSGPGFDFENWTPAFNDGPVYSGRGIGLVQGLCESLHYEGMGNIARAVYLW